LPEKVGLFSFLWNLKISSLIVGNPESKIGSRGAKTEPERDYFSPKVGTKRSDGYL
jgi:hypothetical protein